MVEIQMGLNLFLSWTKVELHIVKASFQLINGLPFLLAVMIVWFFYHFKGFYYLLLLFVVLQHMGI